MVGDASSGLLFDTNLKSTIGAKIGGTQIDRNFHELLAEWFGEAFTELPAYRIGPGSRFMNEFEQVKKNFDGTRRLRPFKLPLVISGLAESDETSRHFDFLENEVLLTRSDLRNF